MQYRQHALSEREKAYLRRRNGIKKPFSKDGEYSTSMVYSIGEGNSLKKPKAERSFITHVKPSFVPMVRGRTGCKLSSVKRLMLQAKNAEREALRAALFASLRGG